MRRPPFGPPAGKEGNRILLMLLCALVLVSGALLVLRRGKESGYIFGLCFLLCLHLAGTLIYIAKKGGFSHEMQIVLYGPASVRTGLQYLAIPLVRLGFMIAVGRCLFPALLLYAALYYSASPFFRKRLWIRRAIPILPAASLVVYFPAVFEPLTAGRLWLTELIVKCSHAWVVLYVVAAALILLREYFSITMRFCRRMFSQKCVLLLSLAALYLLYCQQDPAQVYLFYRSDYMWMLGLWYLSPVLSPVLYASLIVFTVAGSVAGFASLLSYTQVNLREGQEEAGLQRKFDAVSMSASVFVHSIKNQLLANRVLHKRLAQSLDAEPADARQLRECARQLQQNNELLLARVEELYRSVKSRSIRLTPVTLGRLAQNARERFAAKYPEGLVETGVEPQTEVLADEAHLSEAIYNLLVNGWEATAAAGRADTPVRLLSHDERLYTVIEVRDAGVGIPREEHRRIFEPFYSSKNSNFNWGMGLYYVREIAKSHLGQLRLESEPGKGASFYLLLPKYGPARERGLP